MADNTTTDNVNLPLQLRDLTVVPATFNDAENAVDVVWTTGSSVRRYDWQSGREYEEVLDVSTKSVDMTRFESGTLQVLDGHDLWGGVRSILGIATKGSIKGGEGHATLALSRDPKDAGFVANVKAGIIRAISFGYRVMRYEVTEAEARKDGGTLPLYRATLWQPFEISFVTVPADANASTRAQPTGPHSPQGFPCEFVRSASAASPASTSTETQIMSGKTALEQAQADDATRAAPATTTAPAATADALAREAIAGASASARAAEITELCLRHGLQTRAVEFIKDDKKTVDQVRAIILDDLATRSNAGGNQNVRIETLRDEHTTRMQGMEAAVLSRVDATAKLDDNARQYRSLSLVELSRDFLESRGINTRGMTRMDIAGRALQFRTAGYHTSGDFSSLFANVANKRLRQAYNENPGTYAQWARRAPNAPDFKNIQVTALSGAPTLDIVNEHGEFKYGTMKDGAETYAMVTYGKIVALSRQAIVNDDLRGFDRLNTAFGGASKRRENAVVYGILTANAALSDALALFLAANAARNSLTNLQAAGAGSALQASSLVIGRKDMRVQKGLNGEELNVAPAYLIVPAALEQTAYQLTSNQYTPATTGAINEFRQGGRTALEPIVEPLLDANSATAWYLAANNNAIDTVEYCYLDGAEGPVMEMEPGFEVDGVSFKCRLDFAAKAVDYRGLYKSPGA